MFFQLTAIKIQELRNHNSDNTIVFFFFQTNILIFSLALGDWIIIIVHFFKHIEQQNINLHNDTSIATSGWPDDKNGSLLFFIIVSAIGSYALYFGIGGFLHVNIKTDSNFN